MRRGYPELRPNQEFALRAIVNGADSASDLGRRLGVSKQAAAKVIGILEQRGYVARVDDTADSRRKLLAVTPLGHKAMAEGEAIFDDLRAAWANKIGEPALDRLQSDLSILLGDGIADPSSQSITGLEED